MDFLVFFSRKWWTKNKIWVWNFPCGKGVGGGGKYFQCKASIERIQAWYDDAKDIKWLFVFRLDIRSLSVLKTTGRNPLLSFSSGGAKPGVSQRCISSNIFKFELFWWWFCKWMTICPFVLSWDSVTWMNLLDS